MWVKEGYRYPYYPYSSRHHRTDFAHEAGMLLPIQKLQIKDVVADTAPTPAVKSRSWRCSNRRARPTPFRSASQETGEYKIYSDEMFFIQDPRELYKHWPAEVWESIEQHQIKPGMNELQADFAIGMGVPERPAIPPGRRCTIPTEASR